MNPTSLSLLDRVRRANDSEAWSRLHELYAPLMRRWLNSYDVQDADAEDLIQDVLTVVLEELPKFDHNQRVGAFRNWLRKTLVNRLRNFWRSQNNTARPAAAEQLNQLEDDDSGLSRVWNAEHDRHVIAQLLERVRPHFEEHTWEAFRRQIYDGQTANEVADALGMSLNSVYVARSRVLSALRQESDGLVDT